MAPCHLSVIAVGCLFLSLARLELVEAYAHRGLFVESLYKGVIQFLAHELRGVRSEIVG